MPKDQVKEFNKPFENELFHSSLLNGAPQRAWLHIWHCNAICIWAHMRLVQTDSGISLKGNCMSTSFFFCCWFSVLIQAPPKKKSWRETFFAVNIAIALGDMSTVSVLMDITLLRYATYQCMWCRRGQHQGSCQAYFNVTNVLNSQLCGERRSEKARLAVTTSMRSDRQNTNKLVSSGAGGIGTRLCRFVSPPRRNDFSQW